MQHWVKRLFVGFWKDGLLAELKGRMSRRCRLAELKGRMSRRCRFLLFLKHKCLVTLIQMTSYHNDHPKQVGKQTVQLSKECKKCPNVQSPFMKPFVDPWSGTN